MYPEYVGDRHAALLDWLLRGEAEARFGRVPLDFDAEGYLTHNPDLLPGYGHNILGLWLHYWDHGVFEGRVFDELFRVDEYLVFNLDLQSLNHDRQAGVWHWLMHGKAANRFGRVPLAFDWQGYLTRNPDLQAGYGHTALGAWLHYWNYGVFEGRVYDDLFRADEYLALYPDLQALFGTNRQAALRHWLTIGIAEGRHGRF